jgi:hypothetical protein
MPRIDLSATAHRIGFPDDVWAWLELLGEVVAATQSEALAHEDYIADTPHKLLLVSSVNRDLSTLNAVYILLRFELIHQAAAHVRLFCEALITTSYISRDPEGRVPLFLDYATIDEFRILSALLQWERETAKPGPVSALEARRTELQPEYDRLLPKYNRRRPSNWCNATLKTQAEESGLSKLYEIVYGQMSAYVHGSAWSLRRQTAYSQMHYDAKVVLVDVATIVRTTIAVWLEWAKFADSQLGWRLVIRAPSIVAQCDALDAKQFEGKEGV